MNLFTSIICYQCHNDCYLVLPGDPTTRIAARISYLVLVKCTKVIISEEHTELIILQCTIQFTQTMVSQLAGCMLKERFTYQT